MIDLFGEQPATAELSPGLAARLGVQELREHQIEAINAATTDHDVLLVSPTGSGKSLAFWGAGLCLGGLTLVVSPLRSLIADQARRLKELGLPCMFWNSDVKDKVKVEILHQLNQGWPNEGGGFFYTTPESLKGKDLSSHLAGQVRLAVIDEADCVIADRGFRAQYAFLGNTLRRLGVRQRFACTATLPQVDRRFLASSLKLQHPIEITLPVSRSNLEIEIVDRSEYMLSDIINRHPNQTGLIFTATVRCAQKLHELFAKAGHSVALYHGRLPAKEKTKQQDAFMQGKSLIGIATDAFIRGLDKPDIRFVVHYDHPASIEHWLQGFGRAGRDGLPAHVYGCFKGSTEGRQSREFLIKSAFPSVDDLHAVHTYLAEAPFRDQTASAIGETVLGQRGKFAGSACISTLTRFKLADAIVNPEDRRKRFYSAKGDFDQADWGMYMAEKKRSLDRFETLCEIENTPKTEIPGAVDRYFGDTPAFITVKCPF